MVKTKAICIFALALLLIHGASAISTDMKQVYAPQETAIVQISGNILSPILSSQVIFKRNNVIMPLQYDFKKLGDRYFLWAIMPYNPNNYTLLIKNIDTTSQGNIKNIDYYQNFSVSGNLTDYNVEPGLIFTKGNFDISVKNNLDSNLKIDIDFPVADSVELMPGENKIRFRTSSLSESSLFFMHVGKYAIPVYFISNNAYSNIAAQPLLIYPQILENIIPINSNQVDYQFSLTNRRNATISGLNITFNQDLFSVSGISFPFDLEPNSKAYFNLTLNNASSSRDIRETIYLISDLENLSLSVPIFISLTDNRSAISDFLNNSDILNNSDNLAVQNYYCSELSGKVCSAVETCSGQSVSSLDGSCCLATCLAQSSTSSSAWIGYLIAAIVILLLVFVYLKYKKPQISKNLIDKKIDEAEKSQFNKIHP